MTLVGCDFQVTMLFSDRGMPAKSARLTSLSLCVMPMLRGRP
jgi:hypothetical protein